MLLKSPRHRRFEYEPRFYKPEQDRGERFKQRIRLERKKNRRRTRPIFMWGIVLILVLYVYF
ncbi:MAG: hypothetical protein WD295_00385, partial [Bacteroidota bacterium]